MNSLPPRLLLVRFAFALLLFCSTNRAVAAAAKWTDIPKADLEATHCTAYPDAKAEYIFLHAIGTFKSQSIHQCIKIYSAEAAATEGILSIEYYDDSKPYNVFARVVKPDGSSTEYTIKNFRDSPAIKTRYETINKLTASFSGITAGDIVEMKWTYPAFGGGGKSNYCQSLYPTRECLMLLEPGFMNSGTTIFNVDDSKIEQLKDGRVQMIARNLPPFVEEPLSPPTNDIRGWFGIFKTRLEYTQENPQKAWLRYSSDLEEIFQLSIDSPSRSIIKLATEITHDATSDEDKLARLYEWCRTNITNLEYFKDAKLEPQKDIRKQKRPWWPDNTASTKLGYPSDINLLFGALAHAAGFEVRQCMAASRRNSLKVTFPLGYCLLTDMYIGVKQGDTWRLYAPGNYHLPAGLTHWTNESAPYLRCEKDSAPLANITASKPAASVITRKGRFTLDLDGNLEGDIEINSTGHPAVQLKEDAHGQSQEYFDNLTRTELVGRLPTADIGELHWTNLLTTQFPVTLRYHVKVPAYAELVGQRLAFSASYFTKGTTRLFSAATRTHPIFFDYPMRQLDDIEIVLPEGYTLDLVSSPADVTGSAQVMSCHYKTTYIADTRTLGLKRSYEQCSDGCTQFLPEAYDYLKRLSEVIDTTDNHTFMCKPVEDQPAH